MPPEETGCEGTVKIDGLRLRLAPVDGATVGGWRAGDRVIILAVEYVEVDAEQTDEWVWVRGARGEGWSAAYYNRQTFIEYDYSQPCLDVRYGTEQPSAQVDTSVVWHGGHHNVGVTDWSDSPLWKVCKATSDAYEFCLKMKARRPETVVICRDLVNAPYNWHDGAAWMRRLLAVLPAGCDWYEAINEQPAPNGDWRLFADFHIQMMQAAPDGFCLLLFSFAPGHFPISEPGLSELRRVLDYALAHPCDSQTGRRHGVALHQPGYIPPEYCPGEDCGWLNSGWVAGADWRAFNVHYGMRYHGVLTVANTETGFADGYQGTGPWDGLDDCEAVAAGMDLTLRRYASRERIISLVAWWNFSPSFDDGWVDYTRCLPTIERALQ